MFKETIYFGVKLIDSQIIKITLEITETIVAKINFFSKTKKGNNPIIKIK